MLPSRPFAGPRSLSGPLVDLLVLLQRSAHQSCHSDCRGGLRTAIEIARPASRMPSVHCHCSTPTHATCLVRKIAILVSAEAGRAGAHNGVGEEETGALCDKARAGTRTLLVLSIRPSWRKDRRRATGDGRRANEWIVCDQNARHKDAKGCRNMAGEVGRTIDVGDGRVAGHQLISPF